jgi:putative aldouronate transport system substrate-binding protein
MVRKLLLLTIFVMVALSLVWAGGSSEKGTTGTSTGSQSVQLLAKSWQTFKDQPITLKAYWDPPRDFSDMHLDALVPKQILADTGVTLDIKTAVDGTEQSLNLLIASGEWPDFMYVDYERPAAHALVDDSLLNSYVDLNKTYGVDMVKRLNVNQKFVQRTQFGTQDVYFLNQAGIPPEHWDSPWVIKYQSGVMVNKYYYNLLGAPKINSMDDFINLAIRAKTEIPGMKYPVNVQRLAASRKGLFGEPTEVDQLRPFYGLKDPSNFNNPQGTDPKFYFQTDAFVQLLKDLNRMWNAGLIAPDVWTASGGSAKLQYFYAGQGMFDMQNDTDNLLGTTTQLQKTDPRFSAEMLPDFDAVPGKYAYSAVDQLGIGEHRGFAIPKGTKNTLRALTFLDYIFSDDFQLMNIYGIEGQTFTMKDGIPNYTPEFQKELDSLSSAQVQAKYYFNYLQGDLRDGFWALIQRQQSMPPMLEALRGPLAPTIKKFKDITKVAAAQIASYPTGSEELKIYTNIVEVFGDSVARIVVGPPADVESSYKALLTRVEGMGLAKLNAYQGQYIKNFADLVAKFGN